MATLDTERGKLQDQLSEARSSGGRLEASVAADGALLAELRGRLAGVESRLEGEQAARLDSAGRLMAAEVQLRAALERVSELSQAAAGRVGRDLAG